MHQNKTSYQREKYPDAESGSKNKKTKIQVENYDIQTILLTKGKAKQSYSL